MSWSGYNLAIWRGTTNTDGESIGVSFVMQSGETVRMLLPSDDARHLAESILDYLDGTNSHSDKSSGTIPSVSPQEGMNV